MTADPRKQAEADYPLAVGEPGRAWIRSKPFGHEPRMTSRLLIDFGYAVQLLELRTGATLAELGCGSGWMCRLAAHGGIYAEGWDISQQMIEIARERAADENVEELAQFHVGDMEQLDLGHRFDACLVYDALHHTPHADLVFASARRALKEGGRFLLAEPNWKHRFQGREASDRYGVTELGYSPRTLKRLLREAGFTDVERFHNNRKRLFTNRPADVLAHLAEPLTFRALAPFWTQIWLRATAR